MPSPVAPPFSGSRRTSEFPTQAGVLSTFVATLTQLAKERTDLTAEQAATLQRLVRAWSLIADLSLSDLVLWVPTWNEGGHIAVAQVRPTTAPTAVPQDVIGQCTPRSRAGVVEQAHVFGRAIVQREAGQLMPTSTEAYPVMSDGRVIAVVARHCSSAPRVAGQLEGVYLSTADALLAMLVEGAFPPGDPGDGDADIPRVGDGLIRLVLLRDVTDVRRRERALLSKDATIKEIHHRVKNNLQTVAAMLRLQARRSSSTEAREALAEAELRIAAIAVVHESLSTEGGQSVDFDEVADRIIHLVRDLAPGYAAGASVPDIRREGSWGFLVADQAIPLAMALSELAHNAVEHAHASSVLVSFTGDDLLRMCVEDDGVGMQPGSAEAGLGLGIVETLTVSSLQGAFEVGPREGDESGVRAVVEVPRQRP